MKANNDIRSMMVLYGVEQWRVADACGYSESYFCKLMRKELPPDLREKVIEAIKGANEQ